MPDGLENGQTTPVVAGSRIKLGKSLDAPIYVVVKTQDTPPELELRLINRVRDYPESLVFDGSKPVELGLYTSGRPSPYRALVEFDSQSKTFRLTPEGVLPQSMYVYTPKGEDLGR